MQFLQTFTTTDSPRELALTRPPYPSRVGLSLLELTVAMGLLALLMIPVISLLGTSYKVLNASSTRQAGNYARQAALDAVGVRLNGCTQIIRTQARRLTVRQADGTTAQLRFNRGELLWETALGRELLISGLSDVRFSVGAQPGAAPAAGELFLIEVASRGPDEPLDSWSSTQLWVRPAI